MVESSSWYGIRLSCQSRWESANSTRYNSPKTLSIRIAFVTVGPHSIWEVRTLQPNTSIRLLSEKFEFLTLGLHSENGHLHWRKSTTILFTARFPIRVEHEQAIPTRYNSDPSTVAPERTRVSIRTSALQHNLEQAIMTQRRRRRIQETNVDVKRISEPAGLTGA